ncbi:YdcF family protein [Telmatospirillum sp.]|uniref:YdcF family protein n=1 Tax=Telmatospirillum sp. TaxID=2079197 RepID=UPI00284C6EFF|nr:YdcF family protein [Telmatospirillum sp.]MDR3441164.1 YdcF family protein [Telmatospirillum sp.]
MPSLIPFHLPRRRFLHWTPLVLAALWSAGLVWFAADVPDQIDDPATTTDAIVVLTGGSERLDAGLSLLRRKMGRKLFVSGVYRGIDVTELLRLSRQKPEELECCIVLGHTADNTAGNAIETAAWMRAEGYHSLRLVTANYHMRRSLTEFRHAMPAVTIVAHPVFPDKVKHDQWWLWPGTAHLIASEYTKFLAAELRHWAERQEESF